MKSLPAGFDASGLFHALPEGWGIAVNSVEYVAVALRERGGLQFVLAPLARIGGESVSRIGRSHSIALFPCIDGEAGDFGENTSSRHLSEVVRMLVELHQATPAALPVAQTLDLEFAGRRGLEAALKELDRAWHGGPLAEPARAWH